VQALYGLSLKKDAEIQKQQAEIGKLKAENLRLREQVQGHEGQIGALTR
jgi:hypothetical protein